MKPGEKQELAMMECENDTLKLRVKEIGGWKGFRIFFGGEEDNQLWWIIGGWQNQDTFIGERIIGRNSDLSQICMEPLYYSASIENDTGDVI